MQDFRGLDIYKRAIDYSMRIYRFSTQLPSDEKYGLVSQIKRAVSSIPLNISEGTGCGTSKEFAVFVNSAYRSCNEVLTCLELTTKLGLYEKGEEIEQLENQGMELSRMIYAFLKKLASQTYNLSLRT